MGHKLDQKQGRGREEGTRDNMVLELLFTRDKIKEFALLRTESKATKDEMENKS